MVKLKLLNAPWLRIDEFPDSDKVQFCIFTRPIWPIRNRGKWHNEVQFFCSASALAAFTCLEEFPMDCLQPLPVTIEFPDLTVQHVKSDGNGSVMLLLQFKDERNELILYTGQFTSCRLALIGLREFFGKITDIYLDNSIAAIKHTNSMRNACDAVATFITDHPDSKNYLLFDELFGYEEILLMLARKYQFKIQLNELQNVEMEAANLLDVFTYEGQPDLTVFFAPLQNKSFTPEQYKKLKAQKKFFLRFIPCANVDSEKNLKNSLIQIPYSPHPSQNELFNLLSVIKPQRVHPLISSDLSEDQSIKIPGDLLHHECQLIAYEPTIVDVSETSFSNVERTIHEHNLSNDADSFLHSSVTLSGTLSDDSFLRSEPSEANGHQSGEILPKEPPKVVATISLDDSDDDGTSLIEPKPGIPKRATIRTLNGGVEVKIEKSVLTSNSLHGSNNVQVIELDSSDNDTEQLQAEAKNKENNQNDLITGQDEVNNNKSQEKRVNSNKNLRKHRPQPSRFAPKKVCIEYLSESDASDSDSSKSSDVSVEGPMYS